MSALLHRDLELGLLDSKRHLRFAFEVPPGAQGLQVVWDFAPAGAGDVRSMVTLSLRDPERSRGSGHRHGTRHEVQLGERWATPGFFAGPLVPGRWEVTLHTHLVIADTRGELQVRLAGPPLPGAAGQDPAEPAAPAAPARSGWMMGDLHCHTDHSDARWSVGALAAAATRRGLRFLALTDHNTASGRAALRAAAPQLLQVPGVELTTYYGHAVVLGLEASPDWTALTPQRGTRALARQVAEAGGWLTIAHPLAVGDPICTGCTWTYFDWRPEHASHLEVWNGPWHGPHNEAALALWYDLLAAGRRVVATAGTDAHGPHYQEGLGFTCTPATGEAAQLKAQLRGGQTYLSRQACLDLEVQMDGEAALPGSALAAGFWTATLSWSDLPEGCVLYSVVDGARHPTALPGSGELKVGYGVERWLNFELRQADGQLHTLTNPVFARAHLPA